MQVEIRQAQTTPGYLRYQVHHNGKVVADAFTMAAILESAVEGIFRDGRPWMIRS